MKKILDNGVTVITEKQDHVRGVSLGIWIRGGSVMDGEHNGIAHYAEHMAFKGTKTRTTNDIAKAFDALGGDVNAFTAKELTCYYCRLLDRNLYKGLDILSDMVLNPAYNESDTDNERKVILEEINMYEDSPDDLAMGRLSENVWASSPLGKEILGTSCSVKEITPKLLFENLSDRYTGENIVISACGSLDEEEFINKCAEIYGGVNKGICASNRFGTVYMPSLVLTEKPIEQNHIGIGFEGITRNDPRCHALSVFSTILGGSMSSRLFQSVREQSGLAYTVSSQHASYVDAGLFSIYTALSPKSEDKALGIIRKELDKIKNDGITDDEIARAKEQLFSDIILDMESTGAKMKLNARCEIYGLAEKNADAMIEKINAVTKADVLALANDILDYSRVSISVVGRPKKNEFYKGFFE